MEYLSVRGDTGIDCGFVMCLDLDLDLDLDLELGEFLLHFEVGEEVLDGRQYLVMVEVMIEVVLVLVLVLVLEEEREFSVGGGEGGGVPKSKCEGGGLGEVDGEYIVFCLFVCLFGLVCSG